MSDNGTHETNENYNSTPPRVEEEVDVETTESGPLVQYDQQPVPIPDRHQMLDIPLPGERSAYGESGEGTKRRNESNELLTPAVKRMREELSYEYSPQDEFDLEDENRSGRRSILQRLNSNLKQVGKIAERSEKAMEKSLQWMDKTELVLDHIQHKMLDSDRYHQRKFNEVYNMINGMWRTVVEVEKKADKAEYKHLEVKEDTFKIRTLVEDTRQIFLDDRRSSKPVASRGPTPDYQSLSPTYARQEGPGTSAVRLPGHRTPVPTQEHFHQAPMQAHVSPQGAEYPVCIFCNTNFHLPEHCNTVVSWQERRSIVTQKKACCLCLGPLHESDEVCPQKDASCSGCGFKFFKDPNSTECRHHLALCNTRKVHDGSQRKDFGGPTRGGGQKKGARGTRGRGGN